VFFQSRRNQSLDISGIIGVESLLSVLSQRFRSAEHCHDCCGAGGHASNELTLLTHPLLPRIERASSILPNSLLAESFILPLVSSRTHVYRCVGTLVRAPERLAKIRSGPFTSSEGGLTRKAHHAEAWLEASCPRRVFPRQSQSFRYVLLCVFDSYRIS
jgi:hypothetical protein